MTRKTLVHSSAMSIWCNADGTAKTPIEGGLQSHAFVPQSGDVYLTYDRENDRIVKREVIRYSRHKTADGTDLLAAVLGAESLVVRGDAPLLDKAAAVLMEKVRGAGVDFCDLKRYFNYCKAINGELHHHRDSRQDAAQTNAPSVEADSVRLGI